MAMAGAPVPRCRRLEYPTEGFDAVAKKRRRKTVNREATEAMVRDWERIRPTLDRNSRVAIVGDALAEAVTTLLRQADALRSGAKRES